MKVHISLPSGGSPGWLVRFFIDGVIAVWGSGGNMKPTAVYLAALERLKREHAERLWRDFQIRCEAGEWLDSAALKLQKSQWSDHGMGQGIFFSVWLGNKDIEGHKFNYNIHALKLGSQKTCGVKPVAFARAFRSKFKPTGWPNLSTDFGP
ncbi:MAG TPA: hypothetical protein VHH73_05610, partial [Verrucomicrobiae bacterium]|nr:hypothetical protein [Verrucomicrobiae bacterium]